MSINRSNIDEFMERWARWVHQGKLISGYGSLMGKIMDNKGMMSFGQGGGKSPVIDTVEARIEAVLMAYHETNPKTVEVIRIHYGALSINGLSPGAKRSDKALFLGISLKTYESHITKARKHIINQLGS